MYPNDGGLLYNIKAIWIMLTYIWEHHVFWILWFHSPPALQHKRGSLLYSVGSPARFIKQRVFSGSPSSKHFLIEIKIRTWLGLLFLFNECFDGNKILLTYLLSYSTCSMLMSDDLRLLRRGIEPGPSGFGEFGSTAGPLPLHCENWFKQKPDIGGLKRASCKLFYRGLGWNPRRWQFFCILD